MYSVLASGRLELLQLCSRMQVYSKVRVLELFAEYQAMVCDFNYKHLSSNCSRHLEPCLLSILAVQALYHSLLAQNKFQYFITQTPPYFHVYFNLKFNLYDILKICNSFIVYHNSVLVNYNGRMFHVLHILNKMPVCYNQVGTCF